MSGKEWVITMKIAVLAVQGAFEEHEKVLRELGAETVQLRKASDLQGHFDGLSLPGGESLPRTVHSSPSRIRTSKSPCKSLALRK